MLFNCYPSFEDEDEEPVLASSSTYSLTFSRPSSSDVEDELFHLFCFFVVVLQDLLSAFVTTKKKRTPLGAFILKTI